MEETFVIIFVIAVVSFVLGIGAFFGERYFEDKK